jgi:hypothetical protein
MQVVGEVLGGWIFASLSVGVIFTWAFFYPERRARSLQEAHDRSVDTHSNSPVEMKTAWLRWKDTTASDVEKKIDDLAGSECDLDHQRRIGAGKRLVRLG